MEASIRGLSAAYLDEARVAASFEIMGVDTQLVEDGTYFVVESGERIVGCGGWSRRATLFGGDHSAGRDARLLDPKSEPARIRAMYTHPDFARRGVGRLVLSLCEAAAAREGFQALELVATLAGEPLYLSSGYAVTERIDVSTKGVTVPCVRMRKEMPVVPAVTTSYNQIAAEFANARTQFRPNEERYLLLLLEGLGQGSSILDLGCGNGHPIAVFLDERGFKVTGVDGSAAMLAAAQQRLSAHRWVHALIEDVDFIETFDAVVCWDSLFHLPRARWPAVIRNIHRWLKPDGRLLLSSGGLVDADGFTDTMFGHDFFYDSLPPDDLLTLLRSVGFDIVLAEMCDQPDGGRGRGKWATLASA